jgi:hypothetical protein|tara:strand:+ start:183 stop:1415 length:1233 start_codon:yes stop_codon:yes gene_type:complete
MAQIINPKLRELDKKVGDFYKLSARYFGSLVNLHGREIYKEGLANLLQETSGVKPEGRFDELVLDNIQSNLRLNDIVIDYFADPNFAIPVKDFFDRLAGEGTFEYLEERVKSPPWERMWQHSEKRQEKDYSRVNPFTEEAQKSARDWLPRIKEDIIEFGKAEGYLPQDFDMSLLLLPPKDGAEWSNWNSKTKVFSLGSYGFEFFPENGGVIAIPTRAYNVAFHEVLGHGAHQIHSEQMPYSLRFTEEVGSITPTKSITEGVAINAEKKCYDFLRQRLDKLGLSEENVALLEEENDLEQQSRMEYMYYALTKDREVREEGFNGYEHILELTQNPVIARGFKDDFKGSFMDVWRTTGHTLGPLHYQRMLDKAKRELGDTYLDNKDFHKATLMGAWSREVYPDAVSYMAKEKK